MRLKKRVMSSFRLDLASKAMQRPAKKPAIGAAYLSVLKKRRNKHSTVLQTAFIEARKSANFKLSFQNLADMRLCKIVLGLAINRNVEKASLIPYIQTSVRKKPAMTFSQQLFVWRQFGVRDSIHCGIRPLRLISLLIKPSVFEVSIGSIYLPSLGNSGLIEPKFGGSVSWLVICEIGMMSWPFARCVLLFVFE